MLSHLCNLGPRSSTMLEEAGIGSVEVLQAMGSVVAFLVVKRADLRPSLNLLWALEGALTDMD